MAIPLAHLKSRIAPWTSPATSNAPSGSRSTHTTSDSSRYRLTMPCTGHPSTLVHEDHRTPASGSYNSASVDAGLQDETLH